MSANEQFFVGAQTVVCLLQTTQIKQGVSFIAAKKVYTSTNKTTVVCIETELFFVLPGVDASHVYVRARALGCFHSLISTETFRRALTGSVDSCAETECPFSGVTKSGRVWKNGSESNSRSVPRVLTNADDSWVFVDGVEEVLTDDDDDDDDDDDYDDDDDDDDDDNDDDDEDSRLICTCCNGIITAQKESAINNDLKNVNL